MSILLVKPIKRINAKDDFGKGALNYLNHLQFPLLASAKRTTCLKIVNSAINNEQFSKRLLLEIKY